MNNPAKGPTCPLRQFASTSIFKNVRRLYSKDSPRCAVPARRKAFARQSSMKRPVPLPRGSLPIALPGFARSAARNLDPPFSHADAMAQISLFTRLFPVFDLTAMTVPEAARCSRSRIGLLRCPDSGCRAPQPDSDCLQRRFR